MTPRPLVDEAAAAPRKRAFLFQTLTVSVFTFLAKIAGAAKAVAIAKVFGSGITLDSYLLAFLLPSLIADTFCGALIPAIVPRLVELEHRASRADSILFYSVALRRSLFYSLVGSAALAIGIGASVTLGGGAVPPFWRATGLLTLLMLPVIPCNAVANIWRAALNAHQMFAIPAVSVVLTPAIIMLCVLLGGHWGGAWILAVGTTLGAGAELALLGAAVRRSGFPVAPRQCAKDRSEELPKSFRSQYGYLAAATAVSSGALFIGQAMASSLGAGSVSVLNYGTRLAAVLLAIGPAALSVTILPRFSLLVAERNWETLKSSLQRLLWGSAAISGVAAVILVSISAWIVRLTLQRGAFTAADTDAVAAVQAWSLLQMPFVVGITILMRVFSALKANRILLPLSGATLVANVALNYVFMHKYGVAGISLASSTTQALLFAALTGLVFGPGGDRRLRERS